MRNLIVWTIALVSLAINLSGCGRDHVLQDAKTCTLTSAGTTYSYSFRIFQDGIAESRCNVADSAAPVLGQNRHVFETDGDRKRYYCVAIMGDNTLSAPYWTFHRANDGSYATATYSGANQPEQTLACATTN